jgi:hypothetical protein
MRYQNIQLPLHAGRYLEVIIVVVMMTAGCVMGPGKIVIAPEERLKLKDEPEITAFRYAKNVYLSLAAESKK